jgi:hypothetical protein
VCVLIHRGPDRNVSASQRALALQQAQSLGVAWRLGVFAVLLPPSHATILTPGGEATPRQQSTSDEPSHLHFHCAQRSVALPKQVFFAADKRRCTRFPWWLIRIASPFVETFREMLEMTYLWRQPLRLDNRRLVAFLGAEPHTPAVAAVRASLRGLGCLG